MTFYYRPPGGGGLQELRVGETVTIDGVTHRVSAVTVQRAEKDDPALGIKAGDLYYTVKFAPSSESAELQVKP